MNYLQQQLQSDSKPYALYSPESLAGSIHRVAIDLLEQIGTSGLPLLALSQRVSDYRTGKASISNAEALASAEELLEDVLEIAGMRAAELPNIEDAQYDQGEVVKKQIDIAFDLLFAADGHCDTGSDEDQVQRLLIDLAFKLDEEIEQEERDLEELRRQFPPF